MKIHANAKSCPQSRRLLVRRIEEQNWPLMKAAEAAGISGRSASKWLARWRAEGEAGLLDRSSAPKRIPHRTPRDRQPTRPTPSVRAGNPPAQSAWRLATFIWLDRRHGLRGLSPLKRRHR